MMPTHNATLKSLSRADSTVTVLLRRRLASRAAASPREHVVTECDAMRARRYVSGMQDGRTPTIQLFENGFRAHALLLCPRSHKIMPQVQVHFELLHTHANVSISVQAAQTNI